MILQVNNQHKMSSYTAYALTHQIASFEKIAMGRTIDSRVHIKQELCYFVPKLLNNQILSLNMTYVWSMQCVSINFGKRFYRKEKGPGCALLFWIESVTKVVYRLKRTTWTRHKSQMLGLRI